MPDTDADFSSVAMPNLRIASCSAGEQLFFNQDMSDVSIVVNSGGMPWRFPAHSVLLSAQSDVFRRMLSGNFAERENCEITIEDVSSSTMRQMLRYMYCGDIDLENWKEGIELLRAAHKYQIGLLVTSCGKFLEDVITLNNVFYIYNEATTYDLIVLKEKCLRLILDAGFVVLRSKTFETLSKESVLEIVTNSNLNVDSELTVFDALLRWSPMQCSRVGRPLTQDNILLELQPFLQHVCFDDMSDTDKSALPASILSCVKPNNRNRIGYSVSDTLLPHSLKLNFAVDQLIYEFVGDTLTCIRFSTDRPIYLIGLSFIVMTAELPSHLPLVLVKECASQTNMFTLNVASANWKEGIQIQDRKQCETQILLRQPVKLEQKTVYKMFCTDRAQEVQCLKTQLLNQTLFTSRGHINFSVHCEDCWGVTGLIFIEY